MANSQQLIHQLFGQTEQRCLEMFAESIQYADTYKNRHGKNLWGVTLYNNDRVRLNFGSIVVCTLHAGNIWFALDKEFDGTKDSVYLDGLNEWRWTPHYNYVAVPSISGFYLPSGPKKHLTVWPRIRKMHFALIDSAWAKYTKLRKQSQRSHSSDFMNYLRATLKSPQLPDPVY